MIDLFRPYVSPKAPMLAAAALTPFPDGRLFIGQGEQVDRFERALAEILDAEQPVLATNSGTSALDLALQIAGVGPGKAVIATPMTCSASNSPIVTKFARVIWADVDPQTGLISPASVADRIAWCQRHIGRPPAAIVAVDWGGSLCDYPALIEAAQVWTPSGSYRVPIIQDAAHAFLARNAHGVSGARSGADFTCYSFQAIKHLTTVDGGALICLTPVNTERARLLRWYGLDRTQGDSFRCSQDIQEIGFKYHMNDVAATIGLANLQDIDGIVAQHSTNAQWYQRTLAPIDGPAVTFPVWDQGSSWWLYTLLVEQRDAFVAFLHERGVMASPVHRRNDVHPGFIRATYGHMPLPGVDAFAAREVAIPVGWWLSQEDRDQITGSIVEWHTLSR